MVAYNEELTKIKQEIMNLNITMTDAFVIKVLNNLSPDFHTFLAIKNNEARTDKKLPQYEELMQHLKEEENRLKQEGVIDMARVGQNTNGGNSRGDREGRNTRGGSDGRDREKDDRGGSSDGSNREPNCTDCYTNHSPDKEHCPHADLECRNCKRKNHIVRNCRQKRDERYQESSNKNSDDSNKSTTPDTHIGMINLNAIELTVDRLLSNSSTNT